MKFTELKKGAIYNIISTDENDKPWIGKATFLGEIHEDGWQKPVAEFLCEDSVTGYFEEEAIIEICGKEINKELVFQFLLTDPETGEELRPCGPPRNEGENLVLEVENQDGSRKWRHTIKTEEI